MILPQINHTPHNLPQPDRDEFNRALAAKMASLCETIEDVAELSIELAGHLSTAQYCRFCGMAVDAWYAYNVGRICEEVVSGLEVEDGEGA